MNKARILVGILLLTVLGLLGVALFHGAHPTDRIQDETAGEAEAVLATLEAAGAGPLAAGDAKEVPVQAHRKRLQGVQIQVVDGEGTPVPGVPVGLIRDWKGKDGLALNFFWQGRTAGVDGLVEVPAEVFSKVRDARISAFLLLPLARVVHAAVDPDAPGSQPIRLAIPPTGEVRVRVEMEGGLAYPAPAYIRLEARRPGQEFYFDGSVTHSRDWSTLEDHVRLSLQASSAKSDEGFPEVLLVETTKHFQPGMQELVFPWVGLDLELTASRTDRVYGPRAEGPGPRTPGAVVRLDLTFPAAPVLVGRLLDERGELVVDRERLDFLCVGESWEHRGLFSTDAKGEFRLMLEPIHLGARNVSIVLVDDRGLVKKIATALYPEPLAVGEVRIGDLILEAVTESTFQQPRTEKTLLAAGRVVGFDGEPLSNAKVEVFAARFLPDQGLTWEVRPALAARTGASGEFQINGRAETAELMLRAVTTPWRGTGATIASAPLLVPVGSKGLELMIGGGGVVRGSVMTDLGLQPGEISFRLSFPDRRIEPWEITETASAQFFRFSEDEAVGTAGGIINGFHFSGLGAGLATLAVIHVWDDRPLVVLEGIVVPPGAAANDPRLTAIDLRSLLRRVEVTIVDPTGKRSGTLTVALRAGNREVLHGVAWDVPLPLNVGPHPVDLYIEASGFPPMLVPDIQGQRRIVLDPGQVVLLRPHESAQRLESPFRLEVGLERTGKLAHEEWRRRLLLWPSHAGFDRNGEARLSVPSSGEHLLELRLVFEGRGRLERLGIPVTPARVSAGMGVVELTPCPRALAEAIEDFERR